ncbi:circadian clock protein LdpA [Merismopedia glauca]|uniref:4Fe-4S ferredoxin n=1 Tax=Merismopedia glauca CCAP 1448/3 TaxID=1296344 RepID=A0A2T1C9V7_9CYAN|nr:LdpA C-terminal domain-containing domain [Merismopedia glauca]PSB05055.1 4Fe-4S ferredoxin [Merismopedia glauca CCAP 1448/3]
MKNYESPLHALEQGTWFKLICGASYQHLPAIRNLALAYTLAGADCIDVAADPAVISAAKDGILAARELARSSGSHDKPLLMASLNDGEDPHFRKAEFDPKSCPTDCPRPCERVCPAQAINSTGVIDERCYGCGRCIPICPQQLIFTRSHIYTPEAIAPLVIASGVEAIEIHTQVGRVADFTRLWQAIAPQLDKLQLIAVSCTDGEGLIDYLWEIADLMQPSPATLIWQTDGRSMSGDIGKGTTHAAIKLGAKVMEAKLPGFVQLAGGTNEYTVAKLDKLKLLKPRSPKSHNYIAGVAYGSYARTLLSPILDRLENQPSTSDACLETNPQLLWEAVALARSLVSQIKSSSKGQVTSCG